MSTARPLSNLRVVLVQIFADSRIARAMIDTRGSEAVTWPRLEQRRAAAPLAVTTQTVTTFAGLLALKPEWDALIDATPDATIFQSWQWVVTWLQHFTVERCLRVLTLRDRAGRLVGVVPSTLSSTKGVVRILDVIGRGNHLTEYAEATIHPEFQRIAPYAIAKAWATSAPDWDRLQLHNYAAGSALSAAVDLLGNSGYTIYAEPIVAVRRVLPPTWEEFFRPLRKSMRDQLNKDLNRLRKEGRNVELVIAPPHEIDSAVKTLLRLHALRSRSDRLHAHADYFDTPTKRQFFRDVAQRLARRGMFEIALLNVDGQTVAAQACLLNGKRFATYYSGYDPTWAPYSIMMVLTRKAIEHAIERGFDQLDMMCGGGYDKLRWGGELVPLASAVITGPRLRSRIGQAAHRQRVWRWQLVEFAKDVRAIVLEQLGLKPRPRSG